MMQRVSQRTVGASMMSERKYVEASSHVTAVAKHPVHAPTPAESDDLSYEARWRTAVVECSAKAWPDDLRSHAGLQGASRR
jgi:hypothetical protein